MRGGGGQKKFVFVHAQGIKTVHTWGGGGQKWQNSVHVVVECPLKHGRRKVKDLLYVLTHEVTVF